MADAAADPGGALASGPVSDDAGQEDLQTLRADTQEVEEQRPNLAPHPQPQDSQNQDQAPPLPPLSPAEFSQQADVSSEAHAVESEPPTTPGEGSVGVPGKGKGGIKRQPEDNEFHTESVPPPPLSRSAIEGRIRRVFKKRKDGSTPVSDRWVDAWNDTSNGGRGEVMALFEKVGYDRDRSRPKLIGG